MAQVDNIEDQLRLPQEDAEEPQEGLDVVEHLPQHGNEVCQVLEQPHEEERLDEHQERQHDEHAPPNPEHLNRRLVRNVHKNVDETSPHVELVKEVPLVTEVQLKALLLQLSHVVHEGIKQAHEVKDLERVLEHHPGWNVLVDVLLHDEQREDD